MSKKESSRKPLLIGIIAAVVILAILLILLLTQCMGGEPEATNDPTATTGTEVPTYELYWNADRAEYDGKSEAGMSSRMPESDGFFHVRFILDGEEVILKVADRKLINAIDVKDLMGLTFDENGVVNGVLDLDDMPLEKLGWQFYVQSSAKKLIKLNSSESMNGMEVLLELNENSAVYDMTGLSGPVGVICDPINMDRVYAVANLAGEVTHVFIYQRPNYMLTHEAECQHCKKTVTWYEWTKTDAMPLTTGHYQLMNDIQLNGQPGQQEDSKVCIDLNGKRVDGKAGSRCYAMFNAGTELAIMDTSEGQTGVLAAHGKGDQGMVVWVRYGQFHLYGGTLDASDATSKLNGVAVEVGKGKYFYMHGGTIIGGKAEPQCNDKGQWSAGMGGALAIGGKFVMNGGEIRGGNAPSVITKYNADGTPATYQRGFGGNIFMYSGAVMEMNGGTIKGGKAGNLGGNIYMDGTAELTINDGIIYGGTINGNGKNGGNLYLGSKGKVTQNGGSILAGSSRNCAGNVYLNGQYIMNGGVIADGVIRDFKTGKVQPNAASANVFNVNGVFHMYGGKVAGYFQAIDTSATDTRDTTVLLSGYATIDGGEKCTSNLNLSSGGGGITVYVGNMLKGSRVGVTATTGIFTEPTKESNKPHFFSDIEGAEIIYWDGCLALGRVKCICGKSTDKVTSDVHINGCDGELHLWAPWTSTSSLPTTTGKYYLLKDVTTKNQTTMGNSKHHDVMLDTNGKNVTLKVGSGSWDGFRLYRVDNGSNLLITDTTDKPGTFKTIMPAEGTKFTGRIEKGTEPDPETGEDVKVYYEGEELQAKAEQLWRDGNFGMLLWARGGNITIHNGIFDGSNLSSNKTGMVASIGNNTVTDAETGEKTPYYGSLTMYGGKIIGGTVRGNGGITVNGKATLNLHGGEITGGRVDLAGVEVDAGQGGNIFLEGTMNMTGGKVTDGYCHGGTKGGGHGGNIAVSGGLLNVTGGEITGGWASSAGGNIGSISSGARIVLSNAKVTDGEAYQGGNISCYVRTSKLLEVKDGTVVSGGTAKQGGNVYLGFFQGNSQDMEAIFDNAIIRDGVAIQGGTDTGFGGNIYIRNTTGDRYDQDTGKLIATKSAINVTFNNTKVEDGEGIRGGNIWMERANVTMNETTISGGLALHPEYGQGGNIFISGTSNIALNEGTVISGGKADSTANKWCAGGNIYMHNGNMTVDGAVIKDGDARSDGNNIYINGSSVVTLESGSFEGGIGKNENVYMQGGKLIMNGGKLTTVNGEQNLVTNMDGGIADITINGGEIIGAELAGNGANIYLSGKTKFVMNGGLIKGGNSTNGQGGNIAMTSGTKNETYYSATFEMNGGVIEGGKSKYNGGNVCVLNDSVFTMNDGVIRGGHCDDSGGNMYVNGYLNMHGGVMENASAVSKSGYNLFLVNGDMVMTGGEVKGGMGMTNTDSAKAACSLKLSGTPVISKGETGYGLSMGTTASHIPQVEIVEDLKKGASIYVNNTGYISHITDEKNVKYFHPVSDEFVTLYDQQRVFIGQSYCLCGGKDAAWCDHEKLAWAPYSANTIAVNGVHPGVNLQAPGNYYLTENKSKGQQNINADIGGYTVNLDLRGFKWEASGSRTFLVQYNNVLGITDTVGGGSLVGRGISNDHGGSILMQYSSTLNLYAGTLTLADNIPTEKIPNYAGIVELSGSTTMNVYGGVVENGIAKEGGNIYVSENATLNVYEGAVIRGGRASQGGNIWAKGKVNIENATVSNGVAFNENSVSVGYTYGQGGNIFASGSKAIITIEGKDTRIEGGQCETTDWAPGGNIFASSGANVHIEDATVKGGKGSDGHNLYISTDSTVATLKNATFINTSTGSSNIRVERGTVNIEGSTITNEASGAANLSCNESYDGNGNKKVGHYIVKSSTVSGGYPNVKLEGQDTFEMTDTVLDGKNVGQNVSITAGSTFTMHSGTIQNASGSSVYLNDKAKFIMHSGTIQNASGSNVYLTGSSEAVMHSGTITGGKSNIGVNGSSLFTMNGGTVEKGTAKYGANLSMSNSKFILNNGTIQGGVSTSDGGNVCMSGTAELVMNGGEIKDGQAGGYGGNIVVWDSSKVTVNKGATISGGDAAAQGGNVYVTGTAGTLTVAGGTISGGYAKGNGGNIAVNNKATLVLSSGEISGGHTKDSGGNVVVYGRFNMSGGTVKDGISDQPANGMNIAVISTTTDTAAQYHELNLSGGTIAGGIQFNNAYSSFVSVNISGNPVVDKELTSISTKPTYSMKLAGNDLNVGTLTDGAKIMVCGAERIFTTPAPAGAADYFKAETANMNVWQLEDMRLVHGRYSCICGSNSDNKADHIGECDGTKHNWLPVSALPTTSGYYYLISDVTDSGDQRQIKTAEDIYLDLNGKTVTSSKFRMYWLQSTSSLTLTDNGNGQGRVYSAFKNYDQGGLFWLGADTTFAMYGGTLDAPNSTMNSTKSLSGKLIAGSGMQKLFRGTIKAGTVSGMNLGGAATSFEGTKNSILGDMEITATAGTPIYVANGTKIDVSKAQKPETPWVISAAGTFTAGWDDSWKISDYFVLDPALDGEILLVDGELTVGKYHCLCGQKTHVGECNGKDLFWQPWRTHNSLPTGTGNWYLSWDISDIGQQNIGGANDVKLDLNGHNITANVGARVYLTMSTSKLAITDCKGTGVIYGGGHSANGGVILANDTSTWSLYGGTITLRDDAVVCSSGTITQVAYAFNMYGGKILVNKNGGSAIVINDNKTMTMTGGHILNTATREGNAIGTTIDLWTGSTLNMKGGTIETTGKYCRNVRADGKIIMTGGTIKGGHLEGNNNGANISLGGASKGNHISGGTICGGNSANQGGNIALYGTLKISGNAVIKDGVSGGNAGHNIAVISPNKDTKAELEITGGTIAGGVFFNNYYTTPVVTLSGTPVIDKELTTIAQKPTDSLRLSNNDLTIGTLTDGAKIMVSGEEGIFSYAAPAGADKFFHSEVTGLAVWQVEGQLVLVYGRNSCVCGSNSDNPDDHIGDCDGTKHNWLPVTELPATSGYYYLIADVTDSGDQRQIKTAEDIYLDLNGKTVTSKRFRMYWLQSTSSLTITDNGNGKGTIYIDRTSNDQGAIAWPGGSNTFAMYGGTIDATKTAIPTNKILAGLVTAGSGTQKLFRGTIKGGSAPGTNLGGAAIAFEGGKTHILGDMEITSVEGAAIFVNNYTYIDMSKAQKPDTPWTIQASGVFTKGWNENWNISDYFVADPKYGCSIELDEATGELKMGKYYCICGQTPHIGECKGEIFWQPWFAGDYLPNGGNFFLVRDVARSGQTVFNKDTALDLNGYNYTFTVPNYNDGYRMLRSDAGAKISITDCSGKATPGTMKLVYPDLSKSDYDANRAAITKGNEGMLIWVRQAGGSFHLYNGIFDGSAIMATERDGATISVDAGTSLNIYGGTVKPGNIGWSHNIRVSGTMTMTGGVIEGGKANNGGNVSVYGIMYLKGGEIRGGSVTGSAQNILVKPGGKVYMTGGKVTSSVAGPDNAVRSNIAVEVSNTNRGYFEISGGTVENTAKNVRNFSLSGDMTISGGTIKGGKIEMSDNGANIGAWAGSTIIMEGGSILGGNTANQGGNIALYSTMVMSGGTVKDGRSAKDEGHNIAMIHTGGTCTLEMSGGTIAGGIYMNNYLGDATVKLSGSPVIDKSLTSDDAAAKPADSLRISAAKGTTNNTLLDVKGLTGGTVYVKGYTAGQFAINASSGMEAFVKSETYEGETLLPVCYDNGGLYFGKVYCLCGASETGGTHSQGCLAENGGKELVWVPADSHDDFQTSGNYYLTKDITNKDITTVSNTNVVIDLNGHSITRNDGWRSFSYHSKENTTLTITNTGSTGKMSSTGSSTNQGTLFWLAGTNNTLKLIQGEFDASGFTLSASSGGRSGAAICAEGTSPAITMYEGVTLKSGKVIQGGTTNDAYGGGISITGKLDVLGGTIQGGQASRGGNILGHGNSTITLSGNAKVIDGQVNGESGVSVYALGGNIYAGGKLYIKDNAQVTGGKAGMTVAGDWTAGGNIYSGSTLEITGNGQVTGGQSASQGGNIYGNGSSKITVKDSAEISGGKGSSGGNFYLDKGTQFTMSAGTVSEGTATGSGGNFYVVGKSNVNISGGTVEKGTASSKGGMIATLADGSNVPTITISNITLSGGVAASSGGNVYVNCGTTTLTNATLSGGVASYGGNVFVSGGTVTLKNCDVLDGHANNTTGYGQGGNLYISGGTFTLDADSTMSGGHTTNGNGNSWKPGGNGFLAGGTTVIKGTVSGGYDASQGHNFYLEVGSTLNVDGGLVHNTTNGAHNIYIKGGKLNVRNDGQVITEANGSHNIYCNAEVFEDGKTPTITIDSGFVSNEKTTGTSHNIYLSATATLNLNGGTVRNGQANQSTNVYLAGKATKGDITRHSTVNMTGGTITNSWTDGYTGRNVTLAANTEFNMTGGEISNARMKNNPGANILVNKDATFTLKGGTISGGIADYLNNENDTGYGGSIRVEAGGTFNMISGKVTGGKLLKNTSGGGLGGNFFVAGTLNITGGTVEKGEAVTGGNIGTNNGAAVIKISGATIQDGIAQAGGNVYLNVRSCKEFTIGEGTKILNGQATAGSAGNLGINIFLDNGSQPDPTMTIRGATITGGTATGEGGNVYIAGVSGDKARVRIENTTISGGTATTTGGLCASDGDVILGLDGKTVIDGNNGNNLWLANNATIMVGDLTNGSRIGIAAASDRYVTDEVSAEEAAYFVADDPNKNTYFDTNRVYLGQMHCICGKPDGTCTTYTDAAGNTVGCDGKVIKWTAWTSATTLPTAAGNYYLTEDVTITAATTLSAAVVLDLNGYTVTVNDGRMYTMTTGASLILTNTVKDKGGIVVNGDVDNGAVFYQSAATPATLMNVKASMTGGVCAYGGGMIYAVGNVNLLNSIVEGGNTAPGKNAGNIYVAAGATVNMFDSIVRDGTATNSSGGGEGGNFQCWGTLNMYGDSEISNKVYNYASSNIQLCGNSAVLNVYSGKITGDITYHEKPTVNLYPDAQITMGTKRGMPLASGVVVNVKGELKHEIAVTLVAGTPPFAFAQGSGYTLDYASKYWFKPTGDQQVAFFEDGKLYIANGADHIHCECGGLLEGEEGHTCVDIIYQAMTKSNTSLYNKNSDLFAANYYLADDLVMNGSISIRHNADVKICLNGHTLSLPDGTNSRTISMFCDGTDKTNCVHKDVDTFLGTPKLALSDCDDGRDGKVLSTRAKADVGNVIWARYGEVTIYGATLEATGNTEGSNIGLVLGATTGKITTYDVTLIGGVAGQDEYTGKGSTLSVDSKGTLILKGSLTIENSGGLDVYQKEGGTIDVTNLESVNKTLRISAAGPFAKGYGANTSANKSSFFKLWDENLDVDLYEVDGTLCSGHYRCYCGATDGNHTEGCIELSGVATAAEVEPFHWLPYRASTSSIPTSGDYYLIRPISNLASNAVASGATLKLDLNGMNITGKDGERAFSFLNRANSTMIFTDTSSMKLEEQGTVKVTNTVSKTNQGPLFWFAHTGSDQVKNNTLYILAGTFDASGYTIANNGGAILFSDASANNAVHMYGGKMLGGELKDYETVTSRSGGTVCLDGTDNSFTLHGGQIVGGKAYKGGVVYLRGTTTFTLKDGTMTGSSGVYQGGAVYVDSANANFIMDGGNITGGNTTNKGGNVGVANGTFTINGGEISGGNGGDNGGNIWVASTATLEMNGGKVTDGSRSNGKYHPTANLFMVGAARFYMKGGEITGYVQSYNNSTAAKPTIEISGDAKIYNGTNTNNLLIDNSDTGLLTVVKFGTLTEGAKVGISYGVNFENGHVGATGVSASNNNYIVWDETNWNYIIDTGAQTAALKTKVSN